MPTEREGCACWFCSSRRVRREHARRQLPIIVQPEPQWSPYIGADTQAREVA